MSQENVEIVRLFLKRLNELDVDAALSDVAPDAELDWSGSEAPDRGVFRGPAEWSKFMGGRQEGLSDTHYDAAELIDVPPDTVVLVARVRGRGRVSGVETEALGAAVWTLRHGQITRLTLYQTRAQALKAAGLE